jgi:hypothetical protein
MALQFLDKRIIGAIIIDAWQSHFNTEMDPADGQWFTNGPGNNGGLYGQLTDSLASELLFDDSEIKLTPRKVAACTSTIDNRSGLTPENTVTLTYSYQDTTTVTHSTTNSLKVGIGLDIKAKADFLGVGGEVTTKISTEYTYSWNDATTIAKAETKTFQEQVPVKGVPKGKVYRLTLLCDKTECRIPYHADVYLNGQSTANFASPVNGQKIWTVDAGTLCEWVNGFGSAGNESNKYMRDPDPKKQKRGIIRLKGNLTATQTTNFMVLATDITNSYNPQEQPALSREMSVDDVAALGGKVISEQALS